MAFCCRSWPCSLAELQFWSTQLNHDRLTERASGRLVSSTPFYRQVSSRSTPLPSGNSEALASNPRRSFTATSADFLRLCASSRILQFLNQPRLWLGRAHPVSSRLARRRSIHLWWMLQYRHVWLIGGLRLFLMIDHRKCDLMRPISPFSLIRSTPFALKSVSIGAGCLTTRVISLCTDSTSYTQLLGMEKKYILIDVCLYNVKCVHFFFCPAPTVDSACSLHVLVFRRLHHPCIRGALVDGYSMNLSPSLKGGVKT